MPICWAKAPTKALQWLARPWPPSSVPLSGSPVCQLTCGPASQRWSTPLASSWSAKAWPAGVTAPQQACVGGAVADGASVGPLWAFCWAQADAAGQQQGRDADSRQGEEAGGHGVTQVASRPADWNTEWTLERGSGQSRHRCRLIEPRPATVLRTRA